MRFLIVGDVVGKPGRRVLREKLPLLKEELQIDAVIVNGENAAGGLGITPEVCEEIFSYGADVVTSGNHIWDKKEILGYIDREPRLLRPLNYPEGVPGRGSLVLEKEGRIWAVVNLSGRVFMPPLDCPFRRIEQELKLLREQTNIILVDFHAEASSEKIAMGWFLDGKVSCVFGTHTHVATADERILPQGTAYITDIGMTGAHDSVIGIEVADIVGRFLTQLPVKYRVAKENVKLNGIVVEVDDTTGKAREIFRLSVPLAEHV
ncbi:MAG: TIGR00282 family metallophosphoesterase [Candidatus Caldatribacterium sp.]|nr:TIGR00282 family metallophosphoesterase [Candidatus Caldatribacterium sp.]